MLDDLNRALPAHHFDGAYLTQQQLDAALAEGRLDFVVTNPAHYVLNRNQGLNWLASYRDPVLARLGKAWRPPCWCAPTATLPQPISWRAGVWGQCMNRPLAATCWWRSSCAARA
ncbi:hypothetical protein MBH78_18575 [Oceanimonas sp. NS1]|nr:hypothetical protein [Oceanimonas sp. NS1]